MASIDLGLGRITKLLSHLGNPHLRTFKSVHVAGTNGKGSTVSYLLSIITKSNIRNGKFTSPHLLYYNDCISIDDEIYPVSKFNKVIGDIVLQNQSLNLKCTEFELLTATAFKIFELEKVELAIIEVGLGGRLDATNVLEPVSQGAGGLVVSGITKIGMDHEGFLGDSLPAIAAEKGGIIKKHIPVVVDNTNEESVLKVFDDIAATQQSQVFQVGSLTDSIYLNDDASPLSTHQLTTLLANSPLRGDYQLHNLSVALKIIELLKAIPQFKDRINLHHIEAGVRATHWPARLHTTEVDGVEVLLDGAHNESAAIELGKYLEQRRGHGIIFVIGLTKGKSIDKLLKHIVKPSDTIIPVEFSVPEKMPWVSSYSLEEIEKCARTHSKDIRRPELGLLSLFGYLRDLKSQGDHRKVVICGSLYLCADVLRYVESKLESQTAKGGERESEKHN